MTTPAIENSVATLRALITKDMDTFRRGYAAQDAAERKAFALVMTASFVKAAAERFGNQPRGEDIIDFVSDARVRLVGPDSVVPEDAERVIRGALGDDEATKGMSGQARGAAQTSMLLAIALENETSQERVSKILNEAGGEVEAYLAQREQQ